MNPTDPDPDLAAIRSATWRKTLGVIAWSLAYYGAVWGSCEIAATRPGALRYFGWIGLGAVLGQAIPWMVAQLREDQ